jgi:hypothetical protein
LIVGTEMKKQTTKESPEFPRPELYAFDEYTMCDLTCRGWVIRGGLFNRENTYRQSWTGEQFGWTTRPKLFESMEAAWQEFTQKIQGKH